MQLQLGTMAHTDLSMIRIPPHVVHYAEPLGTEVVMNLDVFSPIRDDYRHLIEYQDAEFANPVVTA